MRSSRQQVPQHPNSCFFSRPFAEQPSPLSDQQSTYREVPSSRSLTAGFFASTPFSSCPTSPQVYVLAPRLPRCAHQLRRHHFRLITPQRFSQRQRWHACPETADALTVPAFPRRFSSSKAHRIDDDGPVLWNSSPLKTSS